MPEEVNASATTESPETAKVDVVPSDFREYVKWRTTGESEPESQPEAPAAAEAEAPQAKTVPDSETAEDQEPEEEETDEESSEEEPAAHKRPGSRLRRIDRLTRENEELKRRIAEREESEKPPPQPKEKAAADGEPQLEQFETLQEYQRALALYFHEKARAEDQKAAAVAAVQEAWNGKEKAARKGHADYDEVIDSFKVPEGPGVMAARHAMLEDAHGAEILYYLGKHPKEVQRIAALDPINAVMAIGRLSATIEAASSSVPETAKRITSAPKPPPPVGRPSKTSSDSLDDPEVVGDYRRWEKLRMAQLRRR